MPTTPAPRIPAWPPRSAPRLFVEQVLGEGMQVQLEGNQAHYLTRVMRVGKGDGVILCDNVTGEWASRVAETGKRHVVLEAVEKLRAREGVPDLWLCCALLKKDRFDLVLEKATELGVARIQPVLTNRCVADKLNPERAKTIVTEAAEQCARTALPEVAAPVKLEALLRDWPEERFLYYASERGGVPTMDAFLGDLGKPVAILIGPEGGFTDQEDALIHAMANRCAISLGGRILRAETAAIAAISVWMSESGDWPDAGENG